MKFTRRLFGKSLVAAGVSVPLATSIVAKAATSASVTSHCDCWDTLQAEIRAYCVIRNEEDAAGRLCSGDPNIGDLIMTNHRLMIAFGRVGSANDRVLKHGHSRRKIET
jgi:hypothetical protein